MSVPSHIYKLSDPFDFGKYKGRIIDDILKHNPGYVVWCIENIEWFRLSEADKERAYELYATTGTTHGPAQMGADPADLYDMGLDESDSHSPWDI